MEHTDWKRSMLGLVGLACETIETVTCSITVQQMSRSMTSGVASTTQRGDYVQNVGMVLKMDGGNIE